MKISIIKTRFFKKIIKGILITAIWMAIWQCAYMLLNNELLLPSPIAVIKRIGDIVSDSEIKFWILVFSSIRRIVTGFVLGVVIGVLLGFITSIKGFDALFSPVRLIIRATPIASFIILLWLLVERDSVPVVVSALMVIPIVWGNVSTGIKNIGKEYKELAVIYRINKLKQLKSIYLPGILPYFATALCTGAGLVWKAGIAAEVLVLPKHSIGTELFNAKMYIETVDVFAWTVVVIVVSMILEAIIKTILRWLEKKFAFVGLT